MRLDSVFRMSVYLLTALAGAMLAYAEDAFFPSGITVVLSCIALLFGEYNRKLHLTTLISNGLGLLVIGVVVWESRGERADAVLVAGTHFLVYVTWIVLFQARNIRHYWWLCALSLLQVAVGPLLTLSSGLYGILLLCYVLLAIWTLSVFTLYQGALAFGDVSEEPDGPQRRRPGERRPAGAAQGKPAPGSPADQRPTAIVDPQAALRRAFAADRRSTVKTSIQLDSPGRWITPRFVVGTLTLAFAGQALGMALFLYVPRVNLGSGYMDRDEPGGRGNPVTGFSGDIRLGQLGQILESTDRVMRVGLFDHQTNDPISIDGFATKRGLLAPLFRGSVLDSYRKGRWTVEPRAELSSDMDSWPREPGMIRQEYTLELHKSDILFAMHTLELAVVIPYRRDQHVNIDPDSDVLFLSEQRPRRGSVCGLFIWKRDAFRATRQGAVPRAAIPGRGDLSCCSLALPAISSAGAGALEGPRRGLDGCREAAWQ